jgi:phosphatidylethanolamine-binding protein (PEBP) family uncharacterized protein
MCNFKLKSALLAIILLLTACSTPSPLVTETLPIQLPLTQAASTQIPATIPPATKAPTATNVPLRLTSAAFTEGANISDRYTFFMPGQCVGENYSPPLAWENAPMGAQSFAILVIDPDGGNWTHWLQFNIPAQTSSLPEAVGGPQIGVKGKK